MKIKLIMIIVVSLLVVGGGGASAYFFVLKDSPAEDASLAEGRKLPHPGPKNCLLLSITTCRPWL